VSKAAELYRKAAEQGDADAQNSLGKCYQNGIGVTKDLKKAADWFRKAAKQGDTEAQRTLQDLGQQ
jgi:TPR repeat protein